MIIHATSALDVSNAVKSDELVLIDFYAPWCGPCRALAGILEQIQDTCYIMKVNTDDLPEVANDFEVTALPTMMFYKNGQLLEKSMGVMSQAMLEKKIDSLK